MANISEPLINVVNAGKPKVLIGLDQNGTGSEQGLHVSLPQTAGPSAKRRSLPHLAHQTEHGKPVALPRGWDSRPQGEPKGLRVKEDGESEGCVVMTQIEVEAAAPRAAERTSRESGPTSIWSLVTREPEEPRRRQADDGP